MNTTDKKEIDTNGYWYLYDNPITRVGVFPYLGRQISNDLDPDKIYQVLRPEEELTRPETLESFKLKPLINEHEMLGKEFTPAEEKGIHGTLGENVKFNKDNGVITNNLIVYSEAMKNAIEHGKKELSLGYKCSYDLTPGEYNGQHYDAVQRNILLNHIALVDEGRMGHDVRVMDKAITYGKLDLGLDGDVIDFITIKGNHIPVKEGQTKKEVAKSFVESKKDEKKPTNIKIKQSQKKVESAMSDIINKELPKKRDELSKSKTQMRKDIESGNMTQEKRRQFEKKHTQLEKEIEKFKKEAEQLRYSREKQIEKENTQNDKPQKETYMVPKNKRRKNNQAIRNFLNKYSSSEDKNIQQKEENSKMKFKNKKHAYDEDVNIEINQAGEGEENAEEQTVPPVADEDDVCQDADEDKRKLIDEIGGILKDKVDEELLRTVLQKAEELAYNPSETGSNDEDVEETEEEEKPAEDEDEDKPACDEDEEKKDDDKPAEDEDDEDKPEEEKSLSMDEAIKYIARRDNLVKRIRPLIGDNARYSSMNIKQVVKYACDKLDIKPSLERLEGYLQAKSRAVKTVSLDSMFNSSSESSVLKAYKNQK